MEGGTGRRLASESAPNQEENDSATVVGTGTMSDGTLLSHDSTPIINSSTPDPTSGIKLDSATVTLLLISMFRQMNPATLLSLLPYAYPGALEGIQESLQRGSLLTSTDTSSGSFENGAMSQSAGMGYAQAIAQSPTSSLVAAQTAAILASATKHLAPQAQQSCNVEMTTKPIVEKKVQKLDRWQLTPEKELKLTVDMIFLYKVTIRLF
jgi:hypothetical protein